MLRYIRDAQITVTDFLYWVKRNHSRLNFFSDECINLKNWPKINHFMALQIDPQVATVNETKSDYIHFILVVLRASTLYILSMRNPRYTFSDNKAYDNEVIKKRIYIQISPSIKCS